MNFWGGARREAPVLHGHDAVRMSQGMAQAQLHHLRAAEQGSGSTVEGLGFRV